jgi:flavodoxin
MKALVVYDSVYGNTEHIAHAIGDGLTGEVRVARVGNLNAAELVTVDLLIVGSPVHNGRATAAIDALLKQIHAHALDAKHVAAFDTRFETHAPGIGARIMKMMGNAAERIAKELAKKGGKLVAAPEGFIVEQKEGPLKHGELERARNWAQAMTE